MRWILSVGLTIILSLILFTDRQAWAQGQNVFKQCSCTMSAFPSCVCTNLPSLDSLTSAPGGSGGISPARENVETKPWRDSCTKHDDCDPERHTCTATCTADVIHTWSCDDPQATLVRDEAGKHWCVLPTKEAQP